MFLIPEERFLTEWLNISRVAIGLVIGSRDIFSKSSTSASGIIVLEYFEDGSVQRNCKNTDNSFQTIL